MHVKLPESQRVRNRSFGGAGVSTLVHAVLIGGTVVATTREVEGLRRPEAIENIVFVPPKPPRPADPRPETPRPQQQIATDLPEIPAVPRAPVDLSVIPTTIPDPSRTIGTMSIDEFRSAPRDTVAAPGPGGPEPGEPFAEFMVEKAVVALGGNPSPQYPQFLAAAGVQGDVFVQFVVDSTGRVEPASIHFARSSHRLFEASVRAVLLKSRYAPAEFGGRRVRQLVEQAFSFNLKR